MTKDFAKPSKTIKKWESYEEVATYFLNELASKFGLSHVEGKQKIQGQRSGTEWEIDAKGIRQGNKGFVIIECRHWNSKQPQEKLGSLAYSIFDTGAEGGILVSLMGMQEGAKKIACAENIIPVQMACDNTPFNFILQFLNSVMVGARETISVAESIVVVKKSSDNT
ncbi:MAG: hypothetical protein H3C64_05280 [Candidatus Kuenenia stuttgartiensis]|uniref:Restriction endonuclease type IV Mrr domain-containing protein n=1 Tax=Kuenenia stuttgartiensis TaxID=174633 RepID=A0A2C9CFC1_KUEST|nr:restriction endonuclease [Candidatus Kuenenia stuttgartiensis]MCZ7611789.1 hypothetical protein [Ignavibacterium sp.]MBW7941812.1 hypothetical protein [Candidatus Kuenenia stuttgartiensis]MBZ0192662.1 hypothetical protein [Candidatus Kuenenia stuttgartiensis]SOH04454.1 hypothetical protein KSMBR1_1956 [Candidatus Kuenenia stuttgartiensis]GJQ50488.1 MAG: hypothetical protein HKUEN01_28740 [Candidatus Kuenenia stuttgartiensis]